MTEEYPFPVGCTSGSFGIKVQNGRYHINGNSISFSNPMQNGSAVGVQIENSVYEMTCNYIGNSGSAVLFQGTNFPSTNASWHNYQMDYNTFHDSYLGIVLSNNGGFDYIGTSSNYVENTWSYSAVSPFSETYATNNSVGDLSVIFNLP